MDSSTKKMIHEDDLDLEYENIRPRGLTGLQNLGNTCYLNSALQSLSNCPPLTRYFLDCSKLIPEEKSSKLNLAKSYCKLMNELWHKKRPSYVVPSGIVTGIKIAHPMFKGYTQQDAQEFLRCLMDQLHEELKVAYSDESESEDEGARGDDDDGSNNASVSDHKAGPRRPSSDSLSSQSEDYETCDSGLSSEQSSNGGQDNVSSDEEWSEATKLRKSTDHTSFQKSPSTKEMKENANLQEKNDSKYRPRAVLEGGDSQEQGGNIPVTFNPTSQHQEKRALHKGQAKNRRYESIISQTFDGKILSSVRCLNCNTVSTTKETFQDLSLPIPSKDHLHMLHAGYPGGVVPPKGGSCGEVHQGWISWLYSWMKSWIIGPTITLQDCLLAFFSADELKGDNMYSCEKCKKLRNGLKYSRVLKLPEILSIHLKRFRHEFYSSKIGTYISFPLEGLDMEPYLHRGNFMDTKSHKGCKDEVALYDLVAIICHHGTAGGGHYTSYCLNYLNGQWYEFDDQYVTEVDISQVQNCEAYVLFYRKSNKSIESLRQKVMDLQETEVSLLKFYISRQWLCRFETFAEPGPISNRDFLCKHGGLPPGKYDQRQEFCVEIPQSAWEILHSRFGGGPVCNHLYACQVCLSEFVKLQHRQRNEKEVFVQLRNEFEEDHQNKPVFFISLSWIKQWEAFVNNKTQVPPGPIENSPIIVYKNNQPTLRQTADHYQVSKELWQFLHQIYGGGPELGQTCGQSSVLKPSSQPLASSLAALTKPCTEDVEPSTKQCTTDIDTVCKPRTADVDTLCKLCTTDMDTLCKPCTADNDLDIAVQEDPGPESAMHPAFSDASVNELTPVAEKSIEPTEACIGMENNVKTNTSQINHGKRRNKINTSITKI